MRSIKNLISPHFANLSREDFSSSRASEVYRYRLRAARLQQRLVVYLFFATFTAASARNPVQICVVQKTTALDLGWGMVCTSVVLILSGVLLGARKLSATHRFSKLQETRAVGTQTCGEVLMYDDALKDEFLGVGGAHFGPGLEKKMAPQFLQDIYSSEGISAREWEKRFLKRRR